MIFFIMSGPGGCLDFSFLGENCCDFLFAFSARPLLERVLL